MGAEPDFTFPAVTVCNHVAFRTSYYANPLACASPASIGFMNIVRMMQSAVRPQVAVSESWRPYMSEYLANTTVPPNVTPAEFLARKLSESMAFQFSSVINSTCPSTTDKVTLNDLTRDQIATLWSLLDEKSLKEYVVTLSRDIAQWSGTADGLKELQAMHFYVIILFPIFKSIFFS